MLRISGKMSIFHLMTSFNSVNANIQYIAPK